MWRRLMTIRGIRKWALILGGLAVVGNWQHIAGASDYLSSKLAAIPAFLWIGMALWVVHGYVTAFAREIEKQTDLLRDIHTELLDLNSRGADDDDLEG